VPVDVHKTIAEVVGLLTRSIDKRIEVKRHLDAAPSIVLADPTQLQNAILNLALNARDAMPEGGELVFTTRVETFAEAQPAEELAAGRYVEISVTDTGVGMSPETKRRLFEPFFTTKEAGKGTGLGLASAYGTVKTHGGAIRVVSELTQGSTFTVYLPVHEAEIAKAPASAAVPAPVPNGHGRILIVDDEPVILEMGAAMLRRQGYEVTACGNPCEALEVYRKEWKSIQLVILDMVMPKMGGRELFMAMQEINPAIRAILASGYSLDGEAQAIVDLGVMTFLQKPFRMGTLAQKVAETLAKK
jgi:CheY-like chemotaxis protein